MALIDFYVRNQKLSKTGPKIVGDSINYINCSFTFKTDDWDGASKWVVFSKGDENYRVNLVDDAIPKEAGLNIGAGLWNVSLFGEKGETRITTNSVTVEVEKSALPEGGPLPAISQTEAEQIDAKAQSALNKAEAVEKAAAEGAFVGERGPQGPKGETGEKGEKGDKGETGEQGPKGEKGDKGDKGEKGDKGDTGEQGLKGEDGKGLTILGYYSSVSNLSSAVFNPNVGDIYGIGSAPPYNLYAWDGNEWVDNGQLQGAKGDKGDTGERGPKGDTGTNGTNGISCTHFWNGTILTVTSASGSSSANLKGDKGDKGDAGATGPAYTLTATDKTAIANEVLAAMPYYNGAVT